MRPVRLLCSALVVLAPAFASAQTPRPDSVTEVLRQKARPGTVQEYEASRKKHMDWHKAQNDPWVWEVFEVMTGPETGGYLIASGEHQWKEIEAWVAKMADADAADSQASMGPHIASTQRQYWTQLNAISRLPTSEGRSPAHHLVRVDERWLYAYLRGCRAAGRPGRNGAGSFAARGPREAAGQARRRRAGQVVLRQRRQRKHGTPPPAHRPQLSAGLR